MGTTERSLIQFHPTKEASLCSHFAKDFYGHEQEFVKYLFKDFLFNSTNKINYYQLFSLLNSGTPRIILAWSCSITGI